MRLLFKFNLILITIFACGVLAVCLVSWRLLQNTAEQQVMQNAHIMMQTATAMRSYTTKQIKPLLQGQMASTFLPQSVPAFAATQSFAELRTRYPEYTYKEAALNPTNPQDRATDWESDIIDEFKNKPAMTEVTVTRKTPDGQSLYLCRPLRVTDAACLNCHSTPDQAPKSMLAQYGRDNGFGWQMGDVIGAQIVSVPTALPERMARRAFETLLGSLIGVFAITLLVLNLMLSAIVIRPVTKLSAVADQISRGNLESDDIPVKGRDEIAGLAASFNRMQRSLKKAMSMLEEA